MDVHPLNAVAYQTSTLTSAYFEVITRELDTGSPSVEKKWKKVYVTYKNAGSSKLKIYYSGVQKGGELTWTEISQDATNGQFASTGSWSTTGFKINVNAYSMKIKIASATPGTTLVPYNFEINDITFIFRTKSVK